MSSINTRAATLLARLALVGGSEDTRPEADALAERESIARELLAISNGNAAADRADHAAEDVDRLSRAALDLEHGHESLGALLDAIERRKAALGLNDRRVASLSERLLERLRRPPLEHVATGFPTLDAATRGGLLLRRVHVIGGEPDAGKTALLVQLLIEAARAGYAVAIYAVDEPGEGIEDRIGQSFGLHLEQLEANVERAILWLADAVRSLPHVLLLEQDEDGIATIEDAADALFAHAKRYGCRGAILGIDSLQTARCRAFMGPTPPRLMIERIDAMTSALKSCAKRGLGVYATSEIGRSSYGQKGRREAPSPMAAFKGSGSIEFTMTVGMVLTRIAKGEHAGDVKLLLPKNKRGEPGYRGCAIRLERDPDRCTYTDRGRIDDDAPEPKTPSSAEPAVHAPPILPPPARVERARLVLRDAGERGYPSFTAWLDAIGGKKALRKPAAEYLIQIGEVRRYNAEGCRWVAWRDPSKPAPSADVEPAVKPQES